jgi:hypothetical protein
LALFSNERVMALLVRESVSRLAEVGENRAYFCDGKHQAMTITSNWPAANVLVAGTGVRTTRLAF